MTIPTAKIRGKGLVDRGVYDALELCGYGFYSLRLVNAEPTTPPNLVSIKIPRDLARRLGAAKQPGETLNDVACRVLNIGLGLKKVQK